MKHFNNKLKIFAISALAIGYLGSYECAEGAVQSVTAARLERTVKCQLKVQAEIKWPDGIGETIELYGDEGDAKNTTFSFEVADFANAKLKLTYDRDTFRYSDGSFFVTKTDNNYEVPEEKQPKFELKIKASDSDDMYLLGEEDAEGELIAELENTLEKRTYEITVKPSTDTANVLKRKYKTGNLKFEIIGE